MDSPEPEELIIEAAEAEKPIENLQASESDKDVSESEENAAIILPSPVFVFPQPIQIKEERDEAEADDESLDGYTEVGSEVFEKESSKTNKNDFDLFSNEKLRKLTFLELLDYTKVLSSHFKKKNKKLKKLKEKTKYLVSYFSFHNTNKCFHCF